MPPKCGRRRSRLRSCSPLWVKTEPQESPTPQRYTQPLEPPLSSRTPRPYTQPLEPPLSSRTPRPYTHALEWRLPSRTQQPWVRTNAKLRCFPLCPHHLPPRFRPLCFHLTLPHSFAPMRIPLLMPPFCFLHPHGPRQQGHSSFHRVAVGRSLPVHFCAKPKLRSRIHPRQHVSPAMVPLESAHG